MKRIISALCLILFLTCCSSGDPRVSPTEFVDPTIGADGAGLVFVGASMPFGLVKAGPDCVPASPGGWRAMNFPVEGFSQTHLSGADDPPKYGNVLLMPFTTGPEAEDHSALRAMEDARADCYTCEFEGSGIRTEITAGNKAAIYRFTFPEGSQFRGLELDAGHCLSLHETEPVGINPWVTDGDVIQDTPSSWHGYTAVSGGWGAAKPYKVYFYMETSAPVSSTFETPRAVNLLFDENTVTVRIGVSFLSEEKARENAMTVEYDFDKVRADLADAWNGYLSKMEISEEVPDSVRTLFYTGLYHSILLPSERTGEWAACDPSEIYYDDYFTLWDTYRTVMPLVTILEPSRMAELINSLLTIWKYDGYMPDGRAGNANTAVQGSTNADVVIADAFFKGVDGIDYETALKAMLTDAYVDPVPDGTFSGQGRVGLDAYIKYGYVPSDLYKRGGSRTTDYAYSDWNIARVAEALGHKDVAEDLYKRAGNWRNIWDKDAEYAGFRGYMVPRDTAGVFADSIMYSRIPPVAVAVRETTTPKGVLNKAWNPQFYEANSLESWLCVPHEIPALIELCGGEEKFFERLEYAFDGGHVDPGNEPSFLTPCLYNWVGRPDRTYDRVKAIMREFRAIPLGIPGNDDAGGMSSWYVFHTLGLYPNAGQPYYILHTPAARKSVIHLSNGKTFTIKAEGLSDDCCVIRSATLNGKPYPYSSISHDLMMQGGTLVYKMGTEPGDWGKEMFAR